MNLLSQDCQRPSSCQGRRLALHCQFSRKLSNMPGTRKRAALLSEERPFSFTRTTQRNIKMLPGKVTLSTGVRLSLPWLWKMAPPDYREKPAARTAIKHLTRYLKSARTSQTLMDQMHLVWASTLLPGLLTGPEKKAILDEVLSKQQPDGGFSLSQLVGAWKRKDNTPLDARSDGYATGLIAMVLQQPGLPRRSEPLTRSLAWLRANQDPAEGRWPAWSLNKQRDLNSDAGRFMSDAATAFAVMALAAAK